MSLFIASINSGSNGNCYYVGNGREAVLVDAGISCREIEKRMARLSLSLKDVRAIFISHEHSDHIKGVEVLSRKHKLPVYITSSTYKNSGLFLNEDLLFSFEPYQTVEIGGLSILPFPKLHDASDPHSFVVSGNGVNIGVFTDIGEPCEHVIKAFKSCHAAFLESNYDEQMLEEGGYPFYLKRRIRSSVGHLSNRQALDLLNVHRAGHLSTVLLSHLSRDNNSPQLVQKLFDEHAGDTKMVVASRDYESEVYCISAGEAISEISEPIHPYKAQLDLFS
jgi:phosphoribosyl 1,2-cyclic phosphodiesterase